MSLLQISPINDDRLTCFERPLCAVANWLGREYSLTFLGSFNFTRNYVKTYDSVSQVADLTDLLQMYMWATNITVTTHNSFDAHEANHIFLNELNAGRPIMAFIDSYYCPWYPSYKQSHIKHYVLIVGISLKNKKFICIDRYSSEPNKFLFLPFDDYIKGKGEFFLFEPLCSIRHNDSTIKEKITFHLRKITSCNDIFNNIYEFQKCLLNDFSIENELHNVHIYKVAPIYTWLKGIANSRIKYKNVLSYCQNEYNLQLPETVQLNLENSYKKWWKVLLQVVKAKDSSWPKQEYMIAANTLDYIIQYETSIIDEILLYLS